MVAGTVSATEVESGETWRAMAPEDPGAVEAVFGVKAAVRCWGEPAAPNEVWQVAVRFEGVTGSPEHPAIGAPPFSNVIVPDGEPVAELTDANRLTLWFVTAVVGKATSEVLLGPETCLSVARPLTPPSAAVIVARPIVVEPRICTL